jgi:hypothetical protein
MRSQVRESATVKELASSDTPRVTTETIIG